MAFGFLRKILDKLTGKKSPKKGGGAKDAQRQKRGKRGRHGRDAAARESGEGARKQNRGGADQQRRRQDGGEQQRQARGARQGAAGTERPAAKRERQGREGGSQQNAPRRRERGGQRENARGERGRKGRGRDGAPAVENTPFDEMRPGGVVSAEERARRKEAHAAWSLDSFAVDPAEGKKRFHDFDLPGEVMHGIADLGFQYCTEIQALSLQNALDGKNIAGKAQTGSGKTAAFLVAILTRYLRTPESRQKNGGTPRALVLAPTRELVIQICKDADAIGKYCELRSLAVYGGMDYDRQKSELLEAPVDLLVATPGRLIDFCRSHVVDLSHVDTLVIDEADRMLDMGFIPDIRRIMAFLPQKDKRATMLYSATLNDDVMRLASQWMEEPVRAEVAEESAATDTVRQVVYVCRADDKFRMLYNHLALYPEARTLIFCNRKSTTDDVASSLVKYGIPCEMLSGDVNQNKRLKVLEDFRAGKVRVVVATDVAGRGIHVDALEFVVNFDFPYEAEDYVHRIGRTGRAGNTGVAISFADEDESFQIPEIEKYIKEPLKCTMVMDDDPLLKPLPPPPPRGKKATPAPVDAAAREIVSKREAVTAEELAAAAKLTGLAGEPEKPEAADAPEGPEKPEAQEKPEAPEAPEKPDNPESPEKPDSPETPESPVEPAEPVKPEKPARAPNPSAVIGKTANGRSVELPEMKPVEREMPSFDSAFEKKTQRDESKIYSEPVEQQTRFEDWTPQP